jgi:hypothetical protein
MGGRWNSEKSAAGREGSGGPPSLGEKEKKEIKHLLEENDFGRRGINPYTWTAPNSVSTSPSPGKH